MFWTAVLVITQALNVGPAGRYPSIGAALAAARPGDTILVAAGVYRERVVIEVPVVLIGEGRPVIEGEGKGTVVEMRAPSVISGFEIRGSGRLLDQEDAGVLVLADSCLISDNVLEDVLFGIYLKDSDGSRVTGNRVAGKDRPLGMRGDGIRLWNSNAALVEGNVVRRTRDVVVYFSHGLVFRNNLVTDGRYGLHYMYSSDNLFERNEFARNDVAAFIMYSSDITLRANVFAQATGHSGFGIGLKDADRIEVAGNLIVQNRVGLYLDNSPSARDAENTVRDNIFAYNDAAVVLQPAVRQNEFSGNAFISNVRDVSVSGGGTALANRWVGNRWEDAAQWDADGDGELDLPYRIDRLSDDLFARHPDLRLFEFSPAAATLDALGRFFPLLEPQPIVVDLTPKPLGERPELLELGSSVPFEPPRSSSGGAPLAAALWLTLAGISLWGVWRWPL
ncbi:MAG: nitrous oxide reductase family maturation protein NosD [Gemmatimonadota bacterium]|nr:MAG: nitrous oxide reductase family maturation protein NosD [Gemmatimonadota bacterium]